VAVLLLLIACASSVLQCWLLRVLGAAAAAVVDRAAFAFAGCHTFTPPSALFSCIHCC
jgi:hypothetical protein